MEVNSFWHGERLSNLESLCIASFLRNGIGYNLHVYDPPAGLPKGVVLKDAAETLPRARIFRYQTGCFNLGSVAGFSNLFRYTLLYRTGGWWADTDICLLSPLPCDSNKVYIQQPHKNGFSVANALFKAPAASPVLRHCLEQFAKKDPAQIVHGETGPRLFTEAVLACGRRNDVLGHELFFPVPWWDYQRLFVDEGLSLEGCCTAHFYNAMINSSGLDKNAIFPANAPFERLKKKYL